MAEVSDCSASGAIPFGDCALHGLNAIAGSLMMATVGTLIGTPVGILAGIYLAEFGNRGWLAPTTRFINDILLSVPSTHQ